MTGGNITVFAQATGGDNSPLDCDGIMTLNGATLFAAGTNPMNENPSTSTSQSYYKQTTSLSAGTVINVYNGSSLLYSDKLLRNIKYLLYSQPDVSSSSVSVFTGGSVDSCKSNAFAHSWNSGTAPYTYEFYYKRSTASSWTRFGSNGVGNFKPGSAGCFVIRTYAKDSTGTAKVKDFNLTATN